MTAMFCNRYLYHVGIPHEVVLAHFLNKLYIISCIEDFEWNLILQIRFLLQRPFFSLDVVSFQVGLFKIWRFINLHSTDGIF